MNPKRGNPMTKMYARSCARCTASFNSRWPSQKYCTPECAKAAELERLRAKPMVRPCKICGKPFTVNKPGGGVPLSYCSDPCRAEGAIRTKRRFEERKNAAKPVKHCASCNTVLVNRRRKWCPACLAAATAARKRESAARAAAKQPIKRRSANAVRFTVGEAASGPSYDLRARSTRLRREQLEEFITLTPTENPLPSDPREALLLVLDSFPEFRRAFAEVHGIQVGSA